MTIIMIIIIIFKNVFKIIIIIINMYLHSNCMDATSPMILNEVLCSGGLPTFIIINKNIYNQSTFFFFKCYVYILYLICLCVTHLKREYFLFNTSCDLSQLQSHCQMD